MAAPVPGAGVYPHKDLTEKIIGAAMEVHNQLGAGFLERVYEEALRFELEFRGIPAESQTHIEVSYKGRTAGHYVCDLLVSRNVLCDIKAVSAVAREHEAQLLNYLKATGLKVGLLLNFGTRKLQVKRVVY